MLNENLDTKIIKKNSRKIFGLNKNIFVLGLTSFFNDFSNEMILSSFPAFFTSVLKTGAASLGLVEGIADGASNLLKIYSGNLSDRIQKRKVFIIIGYSLSVAVRPFYVFTGSVASVLGLRFTDRIGKGLREAPRDVIISVSADKNEIGKSFGYHKAMDTLGGVLGPLTAYFILLKWPNNWGGLFMTAFVLGIIAVITLFFVTETVSNFKNSSHDGRGFLSLFTLKKGSHFSKPFKLYLLSLFILSTGSLPVAIILLKTSDIGLLIASIPLFYMVYSASASFFSFVFGRISDKVGASKVLFFGYIILILSYILIAWADRILFLAIAFVALGIFSACTDATQRSFLAKITKEEERGSAYGFLNGTLGFGAMIAGIGGGYIWQVFGANFALSVSGIVVMVGLVIFLSSVRLRNQSL